MTNRLEQALFFVYFDQTGHEEGESYGKARRSTLIGTLALAGWKLGETKAKFGDVVRLAASGQPHRVTVHGKDAVVISASEFERLRALGAATRFTISSLNLP